MAIFDSAESPSSSATESHSAARQAAYVAFLHRVPFVIDALKLGFLPGFREDCTYQQSQFDDLECPVGMLDNDFRNPDLDRYVDRVLEHEPAVGIVGDASDAAEAQSYVDTIRELEGSFPETEFVIVPKCRAVIEAIPADIVLGYSRGYADTLAHEFSDPDDWRGRRVHILGGSPPKQLDVVEKLTQPTLTDDPPADILGLETNPTPPASSAASKPRSNTKKNNNSTATPTNCSRNYSPSKLNRRPVGSSPQKRQAASHSRERNATPSEGTG